MYMGNKIVWLRIRGLPLELWGRECFEKVITHMGIIISIDNETLLWHNLEYARVQMRLSLHSDVKMKARIKINGTLCPVLVEEELSLCASQRCCWRVKHESGCNEDASSKASSFKGFNGWVPYNYCKSERSKQHDSMEMADGPENVFGWVQEGCELNFERFFSF